MQNNNNINNDKVIKILAILGLLCFIVPGILSYAGILKSDILFMSIIVLGCLITVPIEKLDSKNNSPDK